MASVRTESVNGCGGFADSADMACGWAAIILSGGYSSRMRVNKAFLRLDGTPLIEIMIGKASRFEEILIVTNSYSDYAHLEVPGIRVVEDVFPRRGPLSGIHAGLSFMGGDRALVLPCDMPLLPEEVIHYMTGLADAHPEPDVFVPADGGMYQPLCAVYRKGCLRSVEVNLRRGRHKLQDIFAQLDVYPVSMEELARFGDPEDFFENANDPVCFERLRMAAASRRRDSSGPLEVIV